MSKESNTASKTLLAEARARVRGPVVPMTTPCLEDGSIDYEGVAKLTQFYVDRGIRSIIVAGSTGYCYTLTPEEHQRIIEIAVETAAGKAFILGGSTHSGTRISNHLADICQEAGADALLVAVPYYGGTVTPEGTFQHYQSVAQNHDLGVFVYNRGPYLLDVPFFERCAEVERIVGIKDSSNDYDFSREVGIALSERFVILSGGSMRRHLWHWLWGAQAFASGIANLVPEVELEFADCLDRGEVAAARDIVVKYEEPFFKAMLKYNWWESLHVALKVFDLPAGLLRLPLVEPPFAYQQELERVCREIGLLA